MLCDGIHPCFEVSPHSQLGDAGNMRLPNASPLAEPTSLAAAPAVWPCLCGPLAKPLPASVRTMLLQSDTQLGRQSYYEASVLREPPLPLLQGQGDAGVLVAGAGFAGLSAALELAKRGLRAVVLEADRICSVAYGRNGGQALVGYACGQRPFEQQLG